MNPQVKVAIVSLCLMFNQQKNEAWHSEDILIIHYFCTSQNTNYPVEYQRDGRSFYKNLLSLTIPQDKE